MTRTRRPRSAAPRALRWTTALALAIGGLLAGCSPRRALVPDVPPETTLFVQGPVDTVNHVVHLYWFGSDPDGSVIGYEIRFLNPSAPADTQWVPTVHSDSLFTIFTPTGMTRPRFEVRAIDDAGLRDPSPAREDFTFSNQPPTVTFTNRLRTTDTTYASATLTWAASDVDGDGTKLRFLVGLDSLGANARLVAGFSFTVPTDDFKRLGVLPATEPRQVFIRAIDDGGRASALDSMRWVVRAPSTGPRARLLLIDDVPSSNPANFTIDTLYTNTAARNLAPDSYSILRLEFTQPFRSSDDVAQTFKLFEAVVWYRSTQPTFSTLIQSYQDGIGGYLESGGRLYLEGLDLIQGTSGNGPLREEFLSRYFGSDFLYKNGTAVVIDSTVRWGIDNGRILRSTMFRDSLRSQGIFNGLRGFAVRDTNQVALWARSGVLSQPHDYDIPVAVSVPQPSGGRVIVVTVPVRPVNGFNSAGRFMAKVFEQLGLTGP